MTQEEKGTTPRALLIDLDNCPKLEGFCKEIQESIPV